MRYAEKIAGRREIKKNQKVTKAETNTLKKTKDYQKFQSTLDDEDM